ncbi:prephenate dehydrogenase [biofilm metagenome]
MFNNLCIIGVGLIGGSVARAARKRGLAKKIIGFGRENDLQNLQLAKKLGVIDAFSLNIAEAIADVDCIMVATPGGSIESIFNLLKPFWNNNAIYTDVGSTKTNVFAAAERIFGEIPKNLVPAHPIAGAEQSGVVASVDDLFVDKRLIITPSSITDPVALQKIWTFWDTIGTRVVAMDAKRHDAILAATSHLPHIVAFAMVHLLGHKDEQSEIFKYAAGGFRDFTRIASSDPTMWLDICIDNKDEINPLIDELKDELSRIQEFLNENNKQQLFNTFNYAGRARQRFLNIFEN